MTPFGMGQCQKRERLPPVSLFDSVPHRVTTRGRSHRNGAADSRRLGAARVAVVGGGGLNSRSLARASLRGCAADRIASPRRR